MEKESDDHPLVWLFDIDGTLIRTGGAGGLAMGRALHEVFGVPNDTSSVSFSGRTDRGITEDLFAVFDIETTPQNVESFYAMYLSKLDEALSECVGEVLPGTCELLGKLAETDDALGLLTGNMAKAAEMKLKHFELWQYFNFGGFGELDANRADVARRGVVAAEQHLNRQIDPSRVWVIGDTPHDVSCARAHGLNVACVATGNHTFEALSACGPDMTAESLLHSSYFDRIHNDHGRSGSEWSL